MIFKVVEVPLSKIIDQISKITEIEIISSEFTKCFVVEEFPRILGFIGFNDDSRFDSNYYGRFKKKWGYDFELVNFWVDYYSRGKGVGTALLKHVLKKYEFYSIGLGTGYRSSPSAIRLYKKFGFNPVMVDYPSRLWIKP